MPTVDQLLEAAEVLARIRAGVEAGELHADAAVLQRLALVEEVLRSSAAL